MVEEEKMMRAEVSYSRRMAMADPHGKKAREFKLKFKLEFKLFKHKFKLFKLQFCKWGRRPTSVLRTAWCRLFSPVETLDFDALLAQVKHHWLEYSHRL